MNIWCHQLRKKIMGIYNLRMPYILSLTYGRGLILHKFPSHLGLCHFISHLVVSTGFWTWTEFIFSYLEVDGHLHCVDIPSSHIDIRVLYECHAQTMCAEVKSQFQRSK